MELQTELNPLLVRLLVKLTQASNPFMLDVVSLSDCGELIAGTSSTEIKEDETDSSRKRVFDKPCAICGGVASGYHYETPSCNSCKTFFRRTVISGKAYRCIKSDGKCLTTVGKLASKIKCRQCRYERCIAEGMRPETVSTGGNGKESTFTVKQEVPDSPAESCSSTLTDQGCSVRMDVKEYTRCITALGEIEDKIKALRHCDFDPFAVEMGVLYLLERPSILDLVHRYNRIKDWNNHPRISPSRGPNRESPSCRDLPEWLTLDLICSVEYMKRFALFNALPFKKQCDVIHSCGLPITLAMQCYDSVSNGHEMIVLPDGISPVQFLPNVMYDRMIFQHQYDVFVNICDPWKREKVDRTEYMLLKAILFHESMLHVDFTPEVSEDRGKYLRYLFEYLRQKVGSTAPARMAAVISISQTLIAVANKHRNTMLAADSVQTKDHDKLVREVILREVPNQPIESGHSIDFTLPFPNFNVR